MVTGPFHSSLLKDSQLLICWQGLGSHLQLDKVNGEHKQVLIAAYQPWWWEGHVNSHQFSECLLESHRQQAFECSWIQGQSHLPAGKPRDGIPLTVTPWVPPQKHLANEELKAVESFLLKGRRHAPSAAGNLAQVGFLQAGGVEYAFRYTLSLSAGTRGNFSKH